MSKNQSRLDIHKHAYIRTAKAEGNTRGDGADPVAAAGEDRRRTRPAEDEQRDGDEPAADHHARETVLGVGAPALLGRATEIVALDAWRDADCESDTDEDGAEGEADHAVVPAVVLAEDDGVREEERVEEAVDEGDVQTHEEQDGLGHDHLCGQVLDTT